VRATLGRQQQRTEPWTSTLPTGFHLDTCRFIKWMRIAGIVVPLFDPARSGGGTMERKHRTRP
jgi:hypothetical protein